MSSKNKIQIVEPLTGEESDKLIAYLTDTLSISGKPSEVIQALNLMPSDPEITKTAAKKEIATKDEHFSNFTFPFGKTPVFSYTTKDGELIHLSAPQLVYLLKNTQAAYKDTLSNEYLKKGGIDFSYEPIGSTNVVSTGDNSALRAEFKELLDGLTVEGQSRPDIVKNGRKPDQYRVLVSEVSLKTLFPEKFKGKVMGFLAQNMMEYLEFIRDDDDLIIGIVVKKIKEGK